jgi:8-oxo-dGTP diphosphatase
MQGYNVIVVYNKVYWSGLDNNFFDMSLYAGEGNIGHMIEQVNICKDALLCD